MAFLTTQLAEGILAEPHFPESKLRILFTGGDKLHMGPPDHAPFQLVNIYGISAETVARCEIESKWLIMFDSWLRSNRVHGECDHAVSLGYEFLSLIF